MKTVSVPLAKFNSLNLNAPSGSSGSSDDDEEDDDTASSGEEYNEEDHRRLLFGLTRGGMTPQAELALRLIDELKGGGGASEEEEEEDLDSVEDDDFEDDDDDEEEDEGQYGGFPISSPTRMRVSSSSPTKTRTSNMTDSTRSRDSQGKNAYAAFQPENGLGRVRRWLDGVSSVGEGGMVA